MDEHLRRQLTAWEEDDEARRSWLARYTPAHDSQPVRSSPPGVVPTGKGPVPARRPDAPIATDLLQEYFDAQARSRHLDLAARSLQSQGEGFYTIGSAGHESNAAVALALRPTDPALLHYRSGGFYCARAAQVPGGTPVEDVLHSLTASTRDPISGGRHKVFGHAGLSIIPQTSTIGSHLPRAVGLAFSLGRAKALGRSTSWPDDAVVVTSFGDASMNHSTTIGALNAAGYCSHQGVPLPLLLVCEDNGIGISTTTPPGWTEAVLGGLPGIGYLAADGADPAQALTIAAAAAARVRRERRPLVLHLKTVRFMGHAGSDAEIGYRSTRDILGDYARDPLLRTAAALIEDGASAGDVLSRYEEIGSAVRKSAEAVHGTPRLRTAREVMSPLTARDPDAERETAATRAPSRETIFAGKLPEDGPALTLAGSINAALIDLLAAHPGALVFGEDVAKKGGVYGVTRGLRKRFGAQRVFDTLLDEQTILGTALGASLAGLLPIPEIQYLAYVHNAEDQLRGEAGSLAFFSNGQYRNGMVVRIAGLAYQRGFGGHFHNDNSVAALRDIPGLVLAVPSHPAEAPGLLRACAGLAAGSGKVCVFLEPIALYHTRDRQEGDGRWLAPYRPPSADADEFCRARLHGDGEDLLILTYGNGVRMSSRVAADLRAEGISARLLDLRWLNPLPEEDILAQARTASRILIVDEGRRTGGIAEPLMALLTDHRVQTPVARVCGEDSYIPLGPAASTVLVTEERIAQAARDLCQAG
ncbi:thiamine pyrophosphate-dependent enzyme [Sediminivirga luteola]|uniref:MFS transporter n=1 Tax=Sediminivirga luteola TaxID=1774748 RepID=A0A8J2TXJ1_9MICO|nr:MFS transporter [Sediminivirga luteola]